ncbi:hypothetical protein CMI37_26915 [Candidatus Pacearchaeota archaeon]|nr:hypothetical protein [Candidatus Pacearchaeota archaeon]|tara:strand:+ start:3489 stop:3929 length:441 start_codon:yes stop_codon:yes gene_type:complete
MNVVKQTADEVERRGQERLSNDLYGLRHELIGKPCLHRVDGDLKPAIPYGAYRLTQEEEIHVADYKRGKPLLAVTFYDPRSTLEGKDVHVKVVAGVRPDELIPIDPNSKRGQQIYHTLLTWLVNNRDGTFAAAQRREQAAAVSSQG